MQELEPSSSDTHALGRVMVIAAWALALLLLTLFFDHLIRIKEKRIPPTLVMVNGLKQTQIKRNFHNQYITQGSINGKPVIFLLDTGATHVVIPGNLAKELKLTQGLQHIAGTAGGNIVVYETRLRELVIGNIVLNNIIATINPSMTGEEVLLGMNALKRISFSQEGDTLTLIQPSR